MTRRRMLISGIGKRNHVLRLLADECALNGVELIGCDASTLAPARAELIRFEQLPLVNEPDFGQRFSKLLAQHEVAGFLTLIDPEITVLSELSAQGQIGDATFLHPPIETARVCEDKFAFFEWMQAHDIRTIPTSLSPPPTFPHIRKDRRGSEAAASASSAHPTEMAYECGRRERRVHLPALLRGSALLRGRLLLDLFRQAREPLRQGVLAKQEGESYFCDR